MIDAELFTAYDRYGEVIYHEVRMYNHYFFGLFTRVSAFVTDRKSTHAVKSFSVQRLKKRF